jgi:transglutaminase-like putative cysteine protease
MASLYARNAVLDIDYVYLKTGDEIMPLGTVRLTDGRGDIVNEGYGRKHRKGYSLHAEYLDLDHGSPYLVKVMASPVRSIDRTSVSYKKMSQYAYNTFGIRLDELVGEDQYAAWQKGSGSKEEYLDVSGVTDRMRELAGKITGGYESSYEKCRAVESYLRQYSYRMDTGTSGGGDTGSAEGMSRLADGFLFETGEGYCVHFASSMVMLLRLNGIPARLSSGYRYAFPFDRQEVYEVRAESAHAWPEAYIEGFGWVPFEPTAVLPTAEDRTWHRHPEASAAAVDPAYYRPGDEIQVPEPPVHEEAVVEEEEPDNVMDIVKIAAIIAGAVLLMVILIVTGTAALRH